MRPPCHPEFSAKTLGWSLYPAVFNGRHKSRLLVKVEQGRHTPSRDSEGASRLPMVNLFDVEQQTSRGLRAAPFTDFSVSRGGDLMILHARIKAGWI